MRLNFFALNAVLRGRERKEQEVNGGLDQGGSKAGGENLMNVNLGGQRTKLVTHWIKAGGGKGRRGRGKGGGSKQDLRDSPRSDRVANGTIHGDEEVRRKSGCGHADDASRPAQAVAECWGPELPKEAWAGCNEAFRGRTGEGQGARDDCARIRCGSSLAPQVALQPRASGTRGLRRANTRSRPPGWGFRPGAASGERVQVVHAAGTLVAAREPQAGGVTGVTSCPSGRLQEPVCRTGVGGGPDRCRGARKEDLQAHTRHPLGAEFPVSPPPHTHTQAVPAWLARLGPFKAPSPCPPPPGTGRDTRDLTFGISQRGS